MSAQILDMYGCVAIDPDTGDMLAYDWADFEEDGVRYVGWYDGNGEPAGDVEIAIGSGLWVVADAEWQIQCAGQVCNESVPVSLIGGGARMCANPVPTAIAYRQIIVDGYEGDFEGMVSSQVLDQYGCVAVDQDTGDMLAYDWADFEEDGVRYVGWYDGNGEPAGDKILGLGEALWIQADEDGYSVVFPSAL